MSTDTRHALAALLPCPFCGNSKGLAVANENPQDLSGGYFIACPSCDASTGLRFACGEDPIPLLIEQWNRRAALSAQPVAGAVAPTADAVRRSAFELCEFIEDIKDKPTDSQEVERFKAGQRYAAKSIRKGLGIWFIDEENRHKAAQAAPAPAPSAQAVAHPSHQTVREWMPVSEALRLSDLWTAGDLDNCGQWRAAIKVLADEVRALAASPQPEPSAQGEPVTGWEFVIEGDTAKVCSPREGPGFTVVHERSRRLEDRMLFALAKVLASAPSTPPPAVVAVPEGCTPADAAMLRRANHALADEAHMLQEALADLHKQIGEFVSTNGEADFYTGFALAVLAKTRPLEYRWPYSSPTSEEVIARGIAPKAAQEKP